MGVTNHYRGIFVTDPVALSNEDFLAGTTAISESTMAAVREAMTCKPDYLVLGMSAITFYGGIAGGASWAQSSAPERARIALNVSALIVVLTMIDSN